MSSIYATQSYKFWRWDQIRVINFEGVEQLLDIFGCYQMHMTFFHLLPKKAAADTLIQGLRRGFHGATWLISSLDLKAQCSKGV